MADTPVAESTPEDRLASMFGEKPEKASEPEKAPEPETEPEVQEETAEEPAEPEVTAEEPEVPEEPTDEEVEYEGKVYRVPTELKPALLRQADYTRKTMEVAEQRKSLEQQREQFQQLEQFRQSQFTNAVELTSLDNQLRAYESFDWASLADQNPTEYLKLDRQYRELQNTRQHKLVEAQQILAQQQQMTAQQRQQAIQKGQETLAKEIQGWSQDMAQRVAESAKGYGFTDSEIAQVLDPRIVRVLHDAHQWRRLQDRKPEAKRAVQNVRPIKAQTARTTESSQRAAQDADLRAKLKKSGDFKVAEDLLARRFERKFK